MNPRVELKTVYEGIGAFNPTSNPAALTSYGVVDAGDAFNQRNGKLIRHIDQSWIGRFDLGPAYDSVTFRVIHGVWNDANDPVATADILALTAPLLRILGLPLITYRLRVSMLSWAMNSSLSTIPGVVQLVRMSTLCWSKFVKRKYSYKRLQEYQGNSAAQVVDWTHFYGVMVTAGGGTAEIMHTVNFVDV